VQDVTAHPAFKPVVDLKARMYDMAQEPASTEIMSYREASERFSAYERQYTAPLAVIGQSCSTRSLRTQTYQS
jgi:aromatic ring hydroxylase